MAFSSVDQSFLFQSCENGDLFTLEKQLNSLSSTDISLIRDEHQATLLHYAARYGHLNILQYFIEKKQLNVLQLITENGATCAHDAAVCDQLEAIDYLLHFHQLGNLQNRKNSSEKLRWNVKDNKGNTLLHLAAAYGSINVVNYLLRKENSDPHVRSMNGFLPIHCAALNGHDRVIELLLSVAPDTINEQSKSLFTPAYLACQCGSLETIEILSSYQADFRLQDENGANCLHTACLNSHRHVVQWLIETKNCHVTDVDYMNSNSLHYAAASSNELILNYLLEKKTPMIKSKLGNSPLHVAAEYGHHNVCILLIERGNCSVSELNNSGQNPIDIALANGFPVLANELRRRMDLSKSSISSIQLQNATVVRLVVKKRNIERSDASNQVNEDDLFGNYSLDSLNGHGNESLSKTLQNRRFDLSELRARVEEHEANRTDSLETSIQTNDVLMHSVESLNLQNRQRRRSKLPTQTYAPWLKMGNITSKAFQHEIQKVGSNLRKVRRDSLLRADYEAQNELTEARSRHSQSLGPPDWTEQISSTYDDEFSARKNDFKPRSSAIPTAKSHQFIGFPNGKSEMPQWRRDLIERRRTGANGQS